MHSKQRIEAVAAAEVERDRRVRQPSRTLDEAIKNATYCHQAGDPGVYLNSRGESLLPLNDPTLAERN